MAEKDIEYLKSPDEKTKWESTKEFIWNPRTGQFCGRTGASWAKITIFYIVYYACLVAFWTVMLMVFYVTVDYHQPKWKLDSSRIGNSPGVGFRPSPPEENVDSTLIWFRHGSSKQWEYWVDSLNEFLEPYQGGQQHGEHLTTCSFEETRKPEEVCHFNLDLINNNCSSSRKFGYDVGRPCVLIKINRIYGWKPEPYDNNSLPDNMPEDVKKKYDPRNVYISCEGENPADRENIGPINYYPSQSIPNYYFPFNNQPGYLSPFVFVHFQDPTSGVLMNIECKAWAANIKHDRKERLGSVHFELLVD
ncbi:sodium/potassium-transporting ATPase subunit beta-like [Limulus polyphemus]|uniref:Sodium/potassium-transporting ATPase subunit beta-like n=1 Tax=Limulus polyphemus TaxID=6850 RepID=A0ABM1B275_LIMPO|nr:sodium/potassium-transporting ATPase subunit beta-like [Limulus polyphemus]